MNVEVALCLEIIRFINWISQLVKCFQGNEIADVLGKVGI